MSTVVASRRTGSRALARRIVAGVFVTILLVAVNLGLIVPFLGVLPDSVWDRSMADIRAEIVHGAAIGLSLGVLLSGVGLQLARAERWIAPLWVSTFLIALFMVYDATQGTVGDPLWWVIYGLFILVVVLHPRRVAAPGPWHRPSLALTAVAAIPVAVYAVGQARTQFGSVATDPHVADNHYLTMTAVSLTTLVAAALGASALPGRRFAAATAVMIAVLVGIAAVVHPDQASAPPRLWSAAAIAWGLAYAVVALRRRPSPSPSITG